MNDHPEKHLIDTLKAGRYHNQPEVVRALTEAAPILINDLVQQGCIFDKGEYGELALEWKVRIAKNESFMEAVMQQEKQSLISCLRKMT
ncbi:FAD-binding protein [Bacillus sp. N9]